MLHIFEKIADFLKLLHDISYASPVKSLRRAFINLYFLTLLNISFNISFSGRVGILNWESSFTALLFNSSGDEFPSGGGFLGPFLSTAEEISQLFAKIGDSDQQMSDNGFDS